MRVGYKTILWGIHNPLVHGYYVLKAWRVCYKTWPNLDELIAIFFHDIGYWGKRNLDGPEGKQHPYFSMRFVSLFRDTAVLRHLILFHSRSFASQYGQDVSKLALPDKLAITLYPNRLYLLLGSLSGEISEYKEMMGLTHLSNLEWLLETKRLVTHWVYCNTSAEEKANINGSAPPAGLCPATDRAHRPLSAAPD